MTAIDLVYQGVPKTNVINRSNLFSGKDFLLINSPNLALGEGFIFGGALAIDVPGLGEKQIPLNAELADTNLLIKIPIEFSRQKFNQQFLFLLTESINLSIYAIGLNCNLIDIKERVEELESQQNETLTKLDRIEQKLNSLDLAVKALSSSIANSTTNNLPAPIEQPSLPSSNRVLQEFG